MADEWEPVNQPAESAADEWQPVNQPRPDPEAMLRLGLAAPVTRQMVNSNSYVSNVARAFMSGFVVGGGNAPPLGFTAATTEFLTNEIGIFQKESELTARSGLHRLSRNHSFSPPPLCNH